MSNVKRLVIFLVIFGFGISHQTALGQEFKKYLGYEYKSSDLIEKDFKKISGTFFNNEMKFAVEIFINKNSRKRFIFFQRYYTIEGHNSHRKILDIVPINNNGDQTSDFFSSTCFPNKKNSEILFGYYSTNKDLNFSQIQANPTKAWITSFKKKKIISVDKTKIQCFFGTPDDFPG